MLKSNPFKKKYDPIHVAGAFMRFAFFFIPIDWMMNRQAENLPLNHPPVFIVGAPRTGSTIFYQYLTNRYRTVYISNLVHIFYKWILTGMALHSWLLGFSDHNSYESRHGTTNKAGLKAPSEGSMFWHRFFPKARHYYDISFLKQLPEEKVQQFKSSIYNPIKRYDRAFVFKNLGVGQKIAVVKKLIPEAKFIFIKRDPLFTAQSIFSTRRKLKVSKDELWSIKPKNFEELLKLPEHEQVVQQVFYLEKQIHQDLAEVPEQDQLTISYEDLVDDPEKMDQLISSFLPTLKRRSGVKRLKIKDGNKQKIDQADLELLKENVDKFDWENDV